VGGAGLAEDPSLGGGSLTLVLGPGFSGIRAPAAATPSKAKPAKAKPAAELRDYDPRPC
jgi:hypothetical protein